MKKLFLLFALSVSFAFSASAIGVSVNGRSWWGCLTGCRSGSGLCIMIGNSADLSRSVNMTLQLRVPVESPIYKELKTDGVVTFGQDSQLNTEVAAQLGFPETTQVWMKMGNYDLVSNNDGSVSVNIAYYVIQ